MAHILVRPLSVLVRPAALSRALCSSVSTSGGEPSATLLLVKRSSSSSSGSSSHSSGSRVTDAASDEANGSNNRRHQERRLLKYSPSQLYAVVADVAKYKEFVPWCRDSVIIRSSQGSSNSGAASTMSSSSELHANLTVGFDLFQETYTSHVVLSPCVGSSSGSKTVDTSRIVATALDTRLFDRLRTEWRFEPASMGGGSSCWVTFRVEFAFKSALYSRVSDMFMKEVVANMVQAFEGRCRAVYGGKR